MDKTKPIYIWSKDRLVDFPIAEEIMIEELEKIKAEIENVPNDETTKPIGIYDFWLGAKHERKIVLQILEKHIKELGSEVNLPIHCKDCEFYMPEKEYRCFLLPKIHPTEDWFCGFANRKKDK